MVGDRQKNRERTLDHANLAAGADAMLDGRFDAGNHFYPLRVQYEDTDAGGIVYHAQYLAFAERARSAWLRCLGIDQPAMLADDGLGFVVRRIEVDFHLPAGLGDVLDVESGLLRLGGASLKLATKNHKSRKSPYSCPTCRRHRACRAGRWGAAKNMSAAGGGQSQIFRSGIVRWITSTGERCERKCYLDENRG